MVLSQVFAYILLFVIKCRFPSNKSVADIIRDRYDDGTLSKVRKLEKLDFKTRKSQLDVEFLQLCLENNLTPKFLNFKVTNFQLRGSTAYRECQVKLLQQELTNRKSNHRVKENELVVVVLMRDVDLTELTYVTEELVGYRSRGRRAHA